LAKKKETPTLFLEFISEKLVRENCVNFITLEKINWRNKAEKTTGEFSVLENIVGGTKRRKKLTEKTTGEFLVLENIIVGTMRRKIFQRKILNFHEKILT